MPLNLSQILKFTNFLTDFRNIKRTIYLRGSDQQENDAEHSYQLAVLAWYINQVGDLGHNIDKLIKYALIHDLVEVYAGDTYIYSKDCDLVETKEAREKDALVKIAKEFSEFENLQLALESYEQQADPESRFIYVLDKLIPILNIYNDAGRSWKKDEITLQMLLDKKVDKIAKDPDLNSIFQELVILLQGHETELFHIIKDDTIK